MRERIRPTGSTVKTRWCIMFASGEVMAARESSGHQDTPALYSTEDKAWAAIAEHKLPLGTKPNPITTTASWDASQ